jgi:hypothetical protein
MAVADLLIVKTVRLSRKMCTSQWLSLPSVEIGHCAWCFAVSKHIYDLSTEGLIQEHQVECMVCICFCSALLQEIKYESSFSSSSPYIHVPPLRKHSVLCTVKILPSSGLY